MSGRDLEPQTPRYWPHAPAHRLAGSGVFIVTAGTFRKDPFFQGQDRLKGLHDGLLKYAHRHGWRLEAWAVFPNHYHFIAQSPPADPEGARSLSIFIADFHQHSAAWVNRLDETPNRQVWHNYWETRLTYEPSYYARLNYVHRNAVKHGLVSDPKGWPWCSAAWFESTAPKAFVSTIYSFKTDQIKIIDDY